MVGVSSHILRSLSQGKIPHIILAQMEANAALLWPFGETTDVCLWSDSSNSKLMFSGVFQLLPAAHHYTKAASTRSYSGVMFSRTSLSYYGNYRATTCNGYQQALLMVKHSKSGRKH